MNPVAPLAIMAAIDQLKRRAVRALSVVHRPINRGAKHGYTFENAEVGERLVGPFLRQRPGTQERKAFADGEVRFPQSSRRVDEVEVIRARDRNNGPFGGVSCTGSQNELPIRETKRALGGEVVHMNLEFVIQRQQPKPAFFRRAERGWI